MTKKKNRQTNSISDELANRSAENESINLIGEIASPIIDKITQTQKLEAEEETKRLKFVEEEKLKRINLLLDFEERVFTLSSLLLS